MVKIYIALYQTVLKNFIDNPPNHSNKKQIDLIMNFSHKNSMNTRTSILQHHFYHQSAQASHKFTPKVHALALNMSYGHVILLNCSRGASICDPNWHQGCLMHCIALLDALMQSDTNGLTETQIAEAFYGSTQ